MNCASLKLPMSGRLECHERIIRPSQSASKTIEYGVKNGFIISRFSTCHHLNSNELLRIMKMILLRDAPSDGQTRSSGYCLLCPEVV